MWIQTGLNYKQSKQNRPNRTNLDEDGDEDEEIINNFK
jgi:hypothetical protein